MPHGHHRAHDGFLRLAEARGLRVRVIDVHQEAAAAVREIAACGTIITTSLHGLVTADSFGIPAVWTTLDPPLEGGDFKFHDYEAALGDAPTRYLEYDDDWTLDELLAVARRADATDVMRMGDGLVASLAGLRARSGSRPRATRGVLRAPSAYDGGVSTPAGPSLHGAPDAGVLARRPLPGELLRAARPARTSPATAESPDVTAMRPSATPVAVGSTRMAAAPATSGRLLVFAATTGTFAAMASSTGRPKPSYSDGTTTAVADATSPGTRASCTRPTSSVPGMPSNSRVRRGCGGPDEDQLEPRTLAVHVRPRLGEHLEVLAVPTRRPACRMYCSPTPSARRLSAGSGAASKNRSSTPLWIDVRIADSEERAGLRRGELGDADDGIRIARLLSGRRNRGGLVREDATRRRREE